MSKRIADGIRDASGFWKHGHTYQAHPVSCAAALAVQKVIKDENLLENVRTLGSFMGEQLKERLADSIVAPFVFDVRGGGFFWAVEFDFSGIEGSKVELGGQAFSMKVATKCLENNMLSFAASGTMGDLNPNGHCLLMPPFNSTKDEIKLIIDTFVRSAVQALQG